MSLDRGSFTGQSWPMELRQHARTLRSLAQGVTIKRLREQALCLAEELDRVSAGRPSWLWPWAERARRRAIDTYLRLPPPPRHS